MPCNPKRTHNTELELQGSPAVAAKGRQQACKCKHKALGSVFRLPSKCSFVLAFARLSSALCSDCRTSSCECSRSSSCLYPVANCSCSCCWTLSVSYIAMQTWCLQELQYTRYTFSFVYCSSCRHHVYLHCNTQTEKVQLQLQAQLATGSLHCRIFICIGRTLPWHVCKEAGPVFIQSWLRNNHSTAATQRQPLSNSHSATPAAATQK